MSSKKINLDSAKKDELRSLCKKHGVKGYGKLSNDGMRAALRALIETDQNYQTTGPKKDAPVPVVNTPAPAPLVLTAVTTAERETRNNVRRPAPGGKCDEVWRALSQMHAAGVEINAGSVADLAVAKSWSLGNAQTELYQWRRFHGLSKPRAPKEKKPKGAAKLAGLPRMSAEEVVPYTA